MTRMKRVTLCILCVTILMTTVSASVFAELKIGFIRPQYIFSLYQPYLDAEETIMEYQESEMNKLSEMRNEINSEIEDYQSRSMSEEVQQQRQQEIIVMQEAYQETLDELTREGGLFDQKQQEMISPIISDINEILMELGDVEEFDFIFDGNVGGLIYAEELYDLSDRVLNELNKRLSAQ